MLIEKKSKNCLKPQCKILKVIESCNDLKGETFKIINLKTVLMSEEHYVFISTEIIKCRGTHRFDYVLNSALRVKPPGGIRFNLIMKRKGADNCGLRSMSGL